MVNTRNILLWLHIAVVLVTLGPFILFDVLAPGLVRAANVPVLRGIERLTKILGPMTLLIALAGVGLVVDNDGYHFKQGWVTGGLVGYVLIVAIGMGILAPAMRRAVARIEAGEAATAEAARLRIFGVVNISLILTVIWLMVAKPGL